jgi:penicillin-binding protein 1A
LRRLLKLALWGVMTCAILATSALGAFWWYIVRDLPQINSLRDYKPKLITRILARDGSEIGSIAEERRIVVPIESIPNHVRDAFIASEDNHFYEHQGLDYGGIVRATWANLRAGHTVQGGSTITQQVAKTFLLSSERSYRRKLQDMVLALRIEQALDKNDILYLYLNQIYLGSGAYGVEAAAQTYFGKSAKDLSVAEAAVIVGVVPAPGKWTPRRSPKLARKRQELVLRRMQEEHFIDPAQYRAALAEKLVYASQRTTPLEEASKCYVEEVRRWLTERYGEERVMTGGLTVQTSLDPEQQIAAYRAVRKGLRAHSRRAGYRGPNRNVPPSEWNQVLEEIAAERPPTPLPGDGTRRKALVTAVNDKAQEIVLALGPKREIHWGLADVQWARKPDPTQDSAMAALTHVSDALHAGDLVTVERLEDDKNGNARYGLFQEPEAEGALLALEVATGNVTAMIGGYEFERSQFNRAVQARRQPGSSFKPFIYAEALRRGYTPASIVYDTPMVFEDDFGTWKPKNYTFSFSGPITVREALANSKNISTIKILQSVGVQPVVERARAMGVRSELEPNLSLALGSSAVTLAELVRAYAAFPAGGRLLEPVYVREVRSRDGDLLDSNISLLTERPAPYGEGGARTGGANLRGPFTAVAQGPPNSEPASAQPSPSGTQDPLPIPEGYALDPQTAYLMVDMMRAVVEEGTGQRVKALGRLVAGKTGTTNELYDAWFIGYSPSIVAGAWVGYDNIASLGANETGARAASPIFIDFMRVALQSEPKDLSFPVPPGIEFYRIDKKTGLLARGGQEAIFQPFREGTQPTEYEATSAGAPRPTRAPRLD